MKNEVLFTIYKVSNHINLKPLILNAIQSMGEHSLIEKGQSISNTDWQLNKNYNRPYYKFIEPVISILCKELKNKYNHTDELKVSDYWFQQYKNLDYHLWHEHLNSTFSAVYYVDIDGKTPSTTFNILGDEISININEGDILVSPSFLSHCSKPNLSLKTKTVIAFNLA
jgi:hypothetical protein